MTPRSEPRLSNVDRALEEALAALRWIADNTTDLPADFPNQGVRLRQVADRANEALHDVAFLRARSSLDA